MHLERKDLEHLQTLIRYRPLRVGLDSRSGNRIHDEEEEEEEGEKKMATKLIVP